MASAPVRRRRRRGVARDLRASSSEVEIDRKIPKYILWYMNTNTKTLLTVKTDKTLKKAAEETAARVGLPLGTVVNGFLRNFVAEQRIEFSAPLIPNARTRRIIDEARREFTAGKAYGPFKSADEMFESLES